MRLLMMTWALLLSAILPLLSVAQETKTAKPNIILILADDLGIGDLSCMGSKDVRTPHIDRLAKDGILMNRFYANSTVCSPSRAALLSGRYPDLVGVPGVIRQDPKDSWGHLKENTLLLPAILKRTNYSTTLIGKWHLGYQSPNLPNDKGFDRFKGFLGDMMDDYYTHLRGGINWMRDNRTETQPAGHATDIFTDWAIETVDSARKSPNPFFLYLAYNAPHFPIQPPDNFLKRVLERDPKTRMDRAKNIALVEHLDYSIGRLMDALRKNGQLENTLIIFTSDNGGSLPHAQSNGMLNGGKQDMLEGGIRVPAIFCWKNEIKPNQISNQTGILMDILPTLCTIAGIASPVTHEGMDLSPQLINQVPDNNDRTLFWVRREGGAYNGQSYYAARKGSIKLLQNNPFEAFSMYDLDKDPLEKNPLEMKGNAMAAELKKLLMEHIRQSGAVPWQ